jgi:hypothetical protein
VLEVEPQDREADRAFPAMKCFRKHHVLMLTGPSLGSTIVISALVLRLS